MVAVALAIIAYAALSLLAVETCVVTNVMDGLPQKLSAVEDCAVKHWCSRNLS